MHSLQYHIQVAFFKQLYKQYDCKESIIVGCCLATKILNLNNTKVEWMVCDDGCDPAGGNILQISYIPQMDEHSPFRLILLPLGILYSKQSIIFKTTTVFLAHLCLQMQSHVSAY